MSHKIRGGIVECDLVSTKFPLENYRHIALLLKHPRQQHMSCALRLCTRQGSIELWISLSRLLTGEPYAKETPADVSIR